MLEDLSHGLGGGIGIRYKSAYHRVVKCLGFLTAGHLRTKGGSAQRGNQHAKTMKHLADFFIARYSAPRIPEELDPYQSRNKLRTLYGRILGRCARRRPSRPRNTISNQSCVQAQRRCRNQGATPGASGQRRGTLKVPSLNSHCEHCHFDDMGNSIESLLPILCVVEHCCVSSGCSTNKMPVRETKLGKFCGRR